MVSTFVHGGASVASGVRRLSELLLDGLFGAVKPIGHHFLSML